MIGFLIVIHSALSDLSKCPEKCFGLNAYPTSYTFGSSWFSVSGLSCQCIAIFESLFPVAHIHYCALWKNRKVYDIYIKREKMKVVFSKILPQIEGHFFGSSIRPIKIYRYSSIFVSPTRMVIDRISKHTIYIIIPYVPLGHSGFADPRTPSYPVSVDVY